MSDQETRIKGLEWTVSQLRKRLEEAARKEVDAEARGYRRGVQDAAHVLGNELPIGSYTRETRPILKTAKAAILTLLEKAEPSLSPEDKLG